MIADLNLLRLILILNETRQTVTAAKVMNVSQPTVSVMLKKLRDQFDDDLFIRNKNNLEPTPKCLLLIESLPPLLEQLDNLSISKESWDIRDFKGEIQLMLPSPLMVCVGSPLLTELTSLAPNLTVQCTPWVNDTAKALETTRKAWGVSYLPMDTNKTLCERELGDDKFMLVMRTGHPIVSNSLNEVLQYSLCANVIPGYIQPTKAEMLIKKYDLNKHISIRSNNISLMLDVVKNSDFICITSTKCIPMLDEEYRYLDLPPELRKDTFRRQFSLFTHQANRNHPFTDWLHEKIIELTNQSK
ncbi:LysR family transcriptional regulator [Vibrio makurazakiensis]|uniref:LysR family transcriptional regulator n=1 Tax=Vibrio makurazakiensis TaxID=2910250 RepID=UPI003D11A613